MSVGSRITKISIVSICLCAASLIGCSVFNRKVTETYASEYERTVQISKDTLDRLEIDILRVISDRLNTTIIARRPGGALVTIEVIRIDHSQTKVSVRSEEGIFQKRTPKMIHESISTELDKSISAIIQTFGEIIYL